MFVAEILAHYCQAFRQDTLMPLTLHCAKRAVIDWYASAYPGLAMESTQILRSSLAEELGHGSAQTLGGDAAVTKTAALFNGAAAHAAELDDSFKAAMYHPGAATIAAALASAQSVNASGLDFLRAVVLGYEVSTRIGVVLGREHYRYWHNTGTVGAFGACVASAYLLNLDETQFAHALATAATFTAGLQQAFRMDSMSKPLHAGRAAEAGVLAAQLAKQGNTGALDIFEGEVGLGQAMSSGPDWSAVGDTLGKVFNIHQLTIKNHVGCGHVFPAIDCALYLKNNHNLILTDIASIEVYTYQTALDIACYTHPKTSNEARFSLGYGVATALVFGSVRLNAYDQFRLEDTLTRHLLKNLSVHSDPQIDADFPQKRSSKIIIHLNNGETLAHLQEHRKGDPEDPLSDEELVGKYMELSAPVIGLAQSQALLSKLWDLEHGSVSDLKA